MAFGVRSEACMSCEEAALNYAHVYSSPVADLGIHKGRFTRFGALARRRLFANHAHFLAKKHALLHN